MTEMEGKRVRGKEGGRDEGKKQRGWKRKRERERR
jgi:hypothetical protein